MSNIVTSIGSSLGKAGAYVVEGSRLGSTQLAAGFREGYASKTEELRAKRAALGITTKPVAATTKARAARLTKA